MLKKMMFFIQTGAAALAGGCALWSTPAAVIPAEYDLGIRGDAVVAAKAVFGGFSNFSGAGRPLLVRESGGELREDGTSRFILLPEVLIKRGLTEMFSAPVDDAAVRVSGKLWRFEYDKISRKVRMVIEYEIRKNGRSKVLRHDISAPADGSGKSCSAAFGQCVVISARRLAAELTEFEKSISGDKKK